MKLETFDVNFLPTHFTRMWTFGSNDMECGRCSMLEKHL